MVLPLGYCQGVHPSQTIPRRGRKNNLGEELRSWNSKPNQEVSRLSKGWKISLPI